MKIFFNKKTNNGFTRIVNFGIVFKNSLKKPKSLFGKFISKKYPFFKKSKTFLMPKSTTGFTLIELLVVISIISMLSSIVLSSLNDARQKAKDTAASESVRQVENALELYFSDMGGYPQTLYALVTKGSISYIGPEFTYLPIMEDGSTCSSMSCPKYLLSAKIENNIWQVSPGIKKVGPQNALQYCSDLLEDGFTGWKMPTATQLRSAYGSPIRNTFYPDYYLLLNSNYIFDMSNGLSYGSEDGYDLTEAYVRCVKE